MDPNNTHYYPQAAPPAPQPVHHPQALHPDAFSNNQAYNHHWDPDHQRAFLRFTNQLLQEVSSTAGMAAAPNDATGPRCRWLEGGVPCDQSLANFNDLVIHLSDSHGVKGKADMKLDCQWLIEGECCGEKYRRDGFRRHIGTHVGLAVPCTDCEKSYSRSDTMRTHRKKVHGKT